MNRPNPKPEEFFIDLDPITGAKLDPPSQLELKPSPKTPGQFTREANRLIRRHAKGLGDER